MVDTPVPPQAVIRPVGEISRRPLVDWPAIFAGAVFASAIAFLFTTFGAAIGLSMTSLIDGENSAIWAVIAVGLWVMWVAVSSFLAGGYVTGRLRRPLPDATQHEVDVRDGLHGLVMWGVAALIGALLAGATLTGAARFGAQFATETVETAGEVAAAAASAVDGGDMDYLIDRLYRSDGSSRVPDGVRDQTGRILAQDFGEDGMDGDDQAYLVGQIAQRTGVTEEEAQARLTGITDEMQAAEKALADAADTARRVGVLSAFLIAAALVVGAGAAWWASSMGGRHRDEGTDFSNWVRWRR